MKVNQIKVNEGMSVSQLMEQFENSGVLGSGRVSRACNLLTDMLKDENTRVFMSLGGPMVPGGMRKIISNMIKENQVNVLVSSGANITHDLLEAFGGRHYKDLGSDDEALNAEGIGRIALSVFDRLGMIQWSGANNEYIGISGWEKYQSVDKLQDIRKKNAKRQKEYRMRQNDAAKGLPDNSIQSNHGK